MCYLIMSYKVLIYCKSYPIVEVGLSFCVKKSIPEAIILKTNSLDFLSTTESNFNCDLFIFDVIHPIEINFIGSQIATFFKEEKVVFLVETIEIEKLLNLKNITYINKNSSELEILKCLRSLSKKRKSSIRYTCVTKRIQKNNKFSIREKECANLFMKGYSVSQISKELSLKMNTISTYKKRMLQKTNTTNLVQLIKTLCSLKD